MTQPQPTRRQLLKPVQLLGFGFATAAFAGFVTLFAMGFFQNLDGAQRQHVVLVSLIVAGIAFIATLVIMALLMLAVDPAQLTRELDRPLLLPPETAPAEKAVSDAAPAEPAASAEPAAPAEQTDKA